VVDGVAEVDHPGEEDRLAGVQALQLGQFLAVRLEHAGQLEQQVAALAGAHPGPRADVERVPGGGHRRVDVGRTALGHGGDDLAGGRVDHVAALAAVCLAPAAVDEELSGQGPGGGVGRLYGIVGLRHCCLRWY
jgi:hypothetical protein